MTIPNYHLVPRLSCSSKFHNGNSFYQILLGSHWLVNFKKFTYLNPRTHFIISLKSYTNAKQQSFVQKIYHNVWFTKLMTIGGNTYIHCTIKTNFITNQRTIWTRTSYSFSHKNSPQRKYSKQITLLSQQEIYMTNYNKALIGPRFINNQGQMLYLLTSQFKDKWMFSSSIRIYHTKIMRMMITQ